MNIKDHGLVVSIQRCSVHDGFGLRTTVFLKGCNMRCYWCHNPETYIMDKQLQFNPEMCIGCGACSDLCENHILLNNVHTINWESCISCGKCADECYAGALEIIGKEMSVDEVFSEIVQDKEFFDQSSGGVTISGGEPLMQSEFVYSLLNLCKAEGIHTAIETNLAHPFETVERIISVCDLVMTDIKTMNDDKHIKGTKLSNKNTLDNIIRIDKLGKKFIIRTPVIPDFNANADDINAIAEFISPLKNLLYYELLPYNPFGVSKGKMLNINCKKNIITPDESLMNELAETACRNDIKVYISSKKYC